MLRFLLFCFPFLFIWGVDYDCIFIGTSPISLFEALHQHYSGRSVLILDDAKEIGGAWKTIDICDVPHADVGCHHIGNDHKLQEFFERYVGCKLVQMDRPEEPFDASKPGGNGFYFSQGCFELMEALKAMLAQTTIHLELGKRVDAVAIDTANQCVVLTLGDTEIRSNKIFVPYYTSFAFRGESARSMKTNFYHLYLLIADPSPPAFSYQGYGGPLASRMMNLTHFAGLENSGRQLIIFQTQTEKGLRAAEEFLKDLKAKKLLSPSAYVLKEEPYIYEQWGHQHWQLSESQKEMIEVLDTSHLTSISKRLAQWKQTLPQRKA